jgi:hypothetical protein
MTMKRFALAIGLAFASTGAITACGGAQVQPAMPAADNGQPRMQAALQALQGAQSELNAAEPNKGGHREAALQAVAAAIGQVNEGMQYAAAHANEVGEAEGPAEPEPVDEEVKDAHGQVHMANAMVQLREARKQLWHAKHDKGGYRAQALESIKAAMEQVHKGIEFADHHE